MSVRARGDGVGARVSVRTKGVRIELEWKEYCINWIGMQSLVCKGTALDDITFI